MYTCMYVCMCVCVCVCMYACMYVAYSYTPALAFDLPIHWDISNRIAGNYLYISKITSSKLTDHSVIQTEST